MEEECRFLISSFLSSVSRSFTSVDERGFWPVSSSELFPLYSDVQAIQVYERFMKLLDRGLSLREIAGLFPTASAMRFLLATTLVVGLKVARMLRLLDITKEELGEFVCLFLKALRERQPVDPLLLEGRNLAWSEDTVQAIIGELEWLKPEDLRYVPRLIVSLDSLIWSLYYDIFTAAGMDIHGPYDASGVLGSGRVVLVREYFDLAPSELWPEVKGFEPRQVTVYLVYRAAYPRVDYLLHVHSDKPLAKSLEGCAVQSPALIGVREMEDLASSVAVAQAARVAGMSKLNQLRKGIEISYYMLRGFFGYFGESWRDLARQATEDIEEKIKYTESGKSSADYAALFNPFSEHIG